MRPPIYTGLIVAILGSAIGANFVWAIRRLHGTNRDGRATSIPSVLKRAAASGVPPRSSCTFRLRARRAETSRVDR